MAPCQAKKKRRHTKAQASDMYKAIEDHLERVQNSQKELAATVRCIQDDVQSISAHLREKSISDSGGSIPDNVRSETLFIPDTVGPAPAAPGVRIHQPCNYCLFLDTAQLIRTDPSYHFNNAICEQPLHGEVQIANMLPLRRPSWELRYFRRLWGDYCTGHNAGIKLHSAVWRGSV